MAMKGLDHQHTSAWLDLEDKQWKGKGIAQEIAIQFLKNYDQFKMFGRRVGVVKLYADTANLFLLLDIVML